MTGPLSDKGITDTPVVLIICFLLAAMALSIGAEGLDVTERLRTKQKLEAEFLKFKEICTDISHGEEGKEKEFHLDIPEAKITVNGNLVSLKYKGESIKQCKIPLKIVRNGRSSHELDTGKYKVEILSREVKLGASGLLLELSEVKK
ncbi:MAG: hypothetical protein ACOCTL_01145 [Candidatus Hadarchaeota archaeon]